MQPRPDTYVKLRDELSLYFRRDELRWEYKIKVRILSKRHDYYVESKLENFNV